MTTVHSCPTCNGQGTQSRPPWVAGDMKVWLSNGTGSFTCPTCLGRGFVVAPDWKWGTK